jgi:hypothetical protein
MRSGWSTIASSVLPSVLDQPFDPPAAYDANSVEQRQQDGDAVDDIENGKYFGSRRRGCVIAVSKFCQADNTKIQGIQVIPTFEPVIDKGFAIV